jgi:uncharacterized protein (TIGR00255 family)
MRSMTGFGIGEAALGDGRVLLELRALNHRFLELRVRLPNEIADQSFFVEQLAREHLSRGRIDIGGRLLGGALPTALFSPERARTVYLSLLELRDALAPGTEVPLSAVTALPELVTTAPVLDQEELRAALARAFEAARQRLDEMRDKEGSALARELDARLAGVRRLLGEIGERKVTLLDTQRSRLRERVERLLSGTGIQVEPGRLEAEIAILADKSDITEEMVRLSSHFDQFSDICANPGPKGRRLEFLLQEIGREVNTIGSKTQDAPIAHRLVELKAELERVREQVQNVE